MLKVFIHLCSLFEREMFDYVAKDFGDCDFFLGLLSSTNEVLRVLSFKVHFKNHFALSLSPCVCA